MSSRISELTNEVITKLATSIRLLRVDKADHVIGLANTYFGELDAKKRFWLSSLRCAVRYLEKIVNDGLPTDEELDAVIAATAQAVLDSVKALSSSDIKDLKENSYAMVVPAEKLWFRLFDEDRIKEEEEEEKTKA